MKKLEFGTFEKTQRDEPYKLKKKNMKDENQI